MRTLIYHAGALGDFITTLPAIRRWRSCRPHERLTYLGRKRHGDLGRHLGYFDETWDVDCAVYAPLFSADPPESTLAGLAEFDAALVFASDDSPLIASLTAAGVPSILHQPPFPETRIHAVGYHLSLLDNCCPRPADPTCGIPRVDVPRPSRRPDRSAGSGRATLALHPGSGSAFKNWPLDRFIVLAGEFRARGMRVLWVLGPGEEGLSVPGEDDAMRDPPLVNLAGTLADCRLFVGNDSGVTHLAAAVGCPTVAVFGPSDPVIWAPRGRAVRVLRHACREGPCHLTPRAGAACVRTCLLDISVAEVVAAGISLLETAAQGSGDNPIVF